MNSRIPVYFYSSCQEYIIDYYIKHGEGEKSVRKIFSNVEHTYDNFEKQKIQEMEELIERSGIVLVEG